MMFKKWLHTDKYLYFLLIVTNLYKFRLMTAGYFTEPDERRYLMSFSALKHLSTGDVSGFFTAIFSAQARPAEILIKTIPAGLQFVIAKIFHFDVFETKSFYVLFVFNFIIYLGILYVLYKIILLIFKEKKWALFGVLSYSLLLNSYVYLRHIYPYDTSSLILLIILYQILKYYNSEKYFNIRQSYLLGATAFFAYLVYPAYYVSFLAVFIVFLAVNFPSIYSNFKQFFLRISAYIFGSVSLLILFELLAKIGGKSLIKNTIELSKTVTQGDFDESIVFMFKYLLEVEYFIGIFFAVIPLLFLFYYPKFKHKNKAVLGIIFFSYLLMFLYYTGSGYFLHKMTMYGRIVHQFLPVMSIFFVSFIVWINKKYQKGLLLLIASISSIFMFVQINNYLKISYPRDVYWQYLRNYPKDHIIEISEYVDSWSNLPQRFEEVTLKNQFNKGTIIAVNTFYFFPVSDTLKHHVYQIPDNKKVIFDKLHFLNFKSYQYEGYAPLERRNIDKFQFRIRLVK